MSNRLLLPTTLLLVALGVTACSSGGAPTASPTAGTTGSPAVPTASPGDPATGIVHPTGADEVVLRYEEVGGFVPPEWMAARLPYFTLYGDGRVVFIRTSVEIPTRADNIFVGLPIRTAKLTDEQVQGLLEFALSDGGLAIAKTDYQNQMVADASTAVFTINAEGDTKTVSAYGLGIEGEPGPDTRVLAQLVLLSERLRDFDQGGIYASEPYETAAYRGVILEQQGLQGVQLRDWPWTELAPSDFTLPADPNTLPQGIRTLTAEEVAAVGVDGSQDGISGGLFLNGPDGKTYSLVIRPLLPDEQA